MTDPETVAIQFAVDPSAARRVLRSMAQLPTRLTLWRWQPSDPNPMPRFHLLRRRPR